MNDLCAHACPEASSFPRGVASKVTWGKTWGRVRGGRPHEALYVMPLQVLADVNNMPRIQSACARVHAACSASVVFGLCIRAIPFLCRQVHRKKKQQAGLKCVRDSHRQTVTELLRYQRPSV